MRTIPFGALATISFVTLASCSSTPTTISQDIADPGATTLIEGQVSHQLQVDPSITFEAGHPMVDPFVLQSTITVPTFLATGLQRFEIEPGAGLDGVVRLTLPDINNPNLGFRCSGTLMPTGRHILTAAHCFTSDDGSIAVGNPSVTFDLPSGEVTIPSEKFDLHPDWTGLEVIAPGDIAVVKLSQEAPLAAERFGIYRLNNEVGQVFTKVGYGLIGTGRRGTFDDNLEFRKYAGENVFDAAYDTCGDLAFNTNAGPTQLGYDFDNLRRGNDANGFLCGINDDRGQGRQEVGAAPGDSGGPAFINGQVAGVTSHGFTGGTAASDVDNQLNSSFGEFIGDTRVSFYQDWIDARLAE